MPQTKEERRLSVLENNEKNRQRKLKVIRDHKIATGCQNPDCKWQGSFEPWQLQLDHIIPETKSKKLKKGMGFYQLGWDNMMAEIEKCQVLCANCHAQKTHGSRTE